MASLIAYPSVFFRVHAGRFKPVPRGEARPWPVDGGGRAGAWFPNVAFGILLHAVNVRAYQPRDNPVLARLFADTVRAINSSDYSLEQVEVWASNPPDIENWRSELSGRIVFVAEHDSEILGFATFEPNGHIDHLYVHHRFQRRGVASALLRQIEGQGASLGINRIFAEASITARPFFEHAGFRVIAPQTVAVKGASFLNYRMEKLLAESN